MTFFARPNLEDLQFRQLSGSTLTLEGTTRVATVNGLQLTNGSGVYIPITAEGAGVSGDTKHGYSLVYDHFEGGIRLMDVSGGTGFLEYNGRTPTTVEVGGIGVGVELTGKTLQEILEEMLVPVVSGETTQLPSHSFLLSPTTTVFEIGSVVNISGTMALNRGCHIPTYTNTGQIVPTGTSLINQPYTFCFASNSLPTCSVSVTDTGTSPLLCVPFTISAMPQASGIWNTCVVYSQGVDLYDSNGSLVCTFPSGTTSIQSRTIFGILPWYWGRIASGGAPAGSNRPDVTVIRDCINDLNDVSGTSLNNTCKIVGVSTGTISVNFNSTADDYIWFAIPQPSTSKTTWFISQLNNGSIGGVVSPGGNLFPQFISEDVSSPIWGNMISCDQEYKIYISNYQSAATQIMQLRN